jgi:hypothetical protein
VKAFRVVLFLAATLAIWTLGNFALRAVWVVAGLATSTVTTQVLNVVLLVIAAAVAWLILQRVPEGDGSRQSDKPESKSP